MSEGLSISPFIGFDLLSIRHHRKLVPLIKKTSESLSVSVPQSSLHVLPNGYFFVFFFFSEVKLR